MIRSTLKQLLAFGIKEVRARLDGPERPATPGPYKRAMPLTEDPPAPDLGATLPAAATASAAGQTPGPRVIYPRVKTSAPPRETPAPDGIRILAQVSADNRQCTFTADRPLVDGLSWRFPDRASALGSPLAEALFANDQVAWLQFDHDSVVVARRSGKDGDWKPLAEALGQTLRHALVTGLPVLSPETIGALPAPEAIRATLEHVITTEVNPNLAAHGGFVAMREVRGNAVYVEMGGGCQGCSAAAMTLKIGIYNAFRAAVPGVGAIYDLTDHAAGTSPFFQGQVQTPE